MKIKIFLVFSLLLFAFPVFAKKKVNNIFYAQNTLGGFKNSPQSAKEKAKLLKSIGYEGLEGFGYQDFFELKKELDKEGLQMPVNYVALNFENNKKTENPSINQIKEMIKGSSKGSVVYFHLHSNSYKDDKETGDKVVAGILRDLSDFASDFSVKLCVYPHVSFYCETLGHSAKLAKMVNR
jgi:sugar phosphate isomerase/epimerase